MGFLNLTYGINGIGDETGNKPVACLIQPDGKYIIVTADLLARLIEEGVQFVSTDYVAILANAASRDYLITVGDTEGIHLGSSFMAGGDSVIYLYKDTTHTAGAALSERNRNQNDPDGCQYIAITQGPAGGADGTQIFVSLIPGGEKANFSPGGGRAWHYGWILEANTNYLVRITNASGGNTPVSVQFDWHLHT